MIYSQTDSSSCEMDTKLALIISSVFKLLKLSIFLLAICKFGLDFMVYGLKMSRKLNAC